MNVELISVGDEIISGYTVDSNSVFIARKLAEIGFPVIFKTAVGDDSRTMETAFHQALSRAEIVITTGGLGPTDDDVTKRVICKVFKRNLVFHEDVLADLKKRFLARGIEMPAINQNQALLPQGAEFLPNIYGSAIGIVINENDRIFVSMPGVPHEMEAMVTDGLIPYLKKTLKTEAICSRTLHTVGIFESALAEKIAPNLNLPETVKLAYLPSPKGIDLRIIAQCATDEEAARNVDEIAKKIYDLAGDYIYAEDDDTLEKVIGAMLTERGARLAVAESCTAGLLAKTITDVPGSSGYFDRGVVTYSNESKIELLGVPRETVEQFGAVSLEVAEAMASGMRKKSGVDYAVSITGIAGPEGGTEDKPVGTVFIAVASSDKIKSKKYNMGIKRDINRLRSVYAALNMLRKTMMENG